MCGCVVVGGGCDKASYESSVSVSVVRMYIYVFKFGLNKACGLKFCVDSRFDKKHLKKARKHIGQNVVNITIKRKIIVWKPWIIKIIYIIIYIPVFLCVCILKEITW